MRRRRPRAALLLLLAGLTGLACGGLGACARHQKAPRLPAGARVAAVTPLTPAFEGMREVLLQAKARRNARDLAGLQRLENTITIRGLALLKANLPHDLRDSDMERFLDGRAAFGEALKAWAYALETPDATSPGAASPSAASARPDLLFEAVDQLVDTYWAWVDASKGLPPEHSV